MQENESLQPRDARAITPGQVERSENTKDRSGDSSGNTKARATGADWCEAGADYPRPQFRRAKWLSLNGPWKFSFDDEKKYRRPSDVRSWEKTIQVPFAPETPASGIADQSFHSSCWYEKSISLRKPAAFERRRVHLHFGAVDYAAKVWVNGSFQGTHEGGHTPFSFDITEDLNDSDEQTISVLAEDEPHDLAKPRGKQDWQLEPHSIWYPRTTGIWQTVWIEEVACEHIRKIRWEPHLERWEIGCEVFVEGLPGGPCRAPIGPSNETERFQLSVRLRVGDQLLVSDRYEVICGEVHRRLALSDPGIDDFRNELLWSPERPTLIEAEVELWQGDRLLDRVESYTALRSVDVSRDRFALNGRPYFLRLVLDQGYWPETFMTPPSPEHCKRDIELVKAAGFNGVRKHQKIESPWFHYWADRLGLIVWEEMPSAYRFTHLSVERLVREWIEVIERDYNHPCVCVWVPYNESWGVPDLALKTAHQDSVRALYHLTKTLDPNRLVVGNDGWEATATDIIGIHDYDNDPARLLERYGGGVNVSEMLKRRRPAGRLLTLDPNPTEGHPVMLTEFGGIAYADPKETSVKRIWGYAAGLSQEELKDRYLGLLDAIHRSELFSGFCYTQFTDTFQEANGLFYADRRPKIPLEFLRQANHPMPFVREEHLTLEI